MVITKFIRLSLAVVFAVAFNSASAAPPTASPAARSELAPAAKLRVAFPMGASFATKNVATGELRGVAIELGREFAAQLGATFEPIPYPSIANLVEGAKTQQWDVAFLGVDPSRTADLDYAGVYMEVDNTYLVLTGSPIQKIDDADKAGHRIAVGQGSSADIYLTRNFKNAEILRYTGPISSGIALVAEGKAHALAGFKVSLMAESAKNSGTRVIEGRFYGAPLGLGVAKGRPAGLMYATEFLEHIKATNVVQRAVEQAGLQGVTVVAAVPK